MFRTPFSCGYYQQQHIFGETKIILSCLFLLEAHGFEYLYYRPIIIKYDGNTCINYDISASQMLWQMKKTLLGTQIILSLNSIEHKCTLILKFVITEQSLLVAKTPVPPPPTFSVGYFAMTCFIADCSTFILVNDKLRKYCVRAREAGFGTIFNYFLDVVYA